MKLLIVLLTSFQTNYLSGTYTSNSYTLEFLNENKCTLTIPTAWHGSKEQKFNWRTSGEDTVELTKLGFVKYSFKSVQHKGRTYLVDIKNLDNFRANLLVVKKKPSNSANQSEYEKYLIAKEKIDETLSR